LTFKPLYDRLLVRRVDVVEQTASGLYIPAAAQEKSLSGTVVSAGHGRLNEDGEIVPLQVAAGDTVLFGRYAGTDIEIDSVAYLILREDDVLGVVR